MIYWSSFPHYFRHFQLICVQILKWFNIRKATICSYYIIGKEHLYPTATSVFPLCNRREKVLVSREGSTWYTKRNLWWSVDLQTGRNLTNTQPNTVSSCSQPHTFHVISFNSSTYPVSVLSKKQVGRSQQQFCFLLDPKSNFFFQDV